MAGQHQLRRPRLIEAMGERWQRRVVSLVAGAGFGKSTSLAQAMAENALAPRGRDVLVACTPLDREPAAFLHHVARALDLRRPASRHQATLDRVLDALGAAGELCLLIDDVDVVATSESGAQVLTELVRRAAPSVHIVVAGRTRVRGLARARAAGQVLDIDEGALAFTDDEIAALTDGCSTDRTAVASMAGWPAPTALAVAGGLAAAIEYAWENVLDGFRDGELAALSLAAALGDGDVALVRDAVAVDALDVAAVLRHVPFATVDDCGEFTVHALWQRVLGDVLDRPSLHAARARAMDALVERGRHDPAFRFCAARGDWPGAARVITASSGRGHAAVDRATLADWLALLPADRLDEPDGLLVRGAIGRRTDPFGPATVELLERAMVGFRSCGDIAGEVAAGTELFYVLRNMGRVAECVGFLERATELDAAGHPEALVPAAVGRGLLAEASGDDAGMVATLAALPRSALDRHWSVVVDFRLLMGHLVLGNEPEMLAAAARCADAAGMTADRNALAMAEWFAGRPARAFAELDTIASDADSSGVYGVVFGTLAAVVLATAGRVDEAHARLAHVAGLGSTPLGPLLRGALTWASTSVAIAAGDDDGASKALTSALAGGSLDDPLVWRSAARWFPLAYVLVPSVRATIDARSLGPLHRRRLDVARAVVWAGEKPSAAAGAPPAIDAGLVATTVPLPWAMRLAGALCACDHAGGRMLVEQLYELHGDAARRALRAVATGVAKRPADGARKLLAAVPLCPAQPVRVGILGPTVLEVDGGAVLDAHWARERVRSLLVFLALHDGATRDQLVDALWPHLDAAAGERNLRVTLTYLNQVLEPGRGAGEAPFFVRQVGNRLSIVRTSAVEVDASAFEALLDDADDFDRRGLPSVAHERRRAALALWRGPCLCDVAYEEWAQTTAARLTMRFVGASVRAAEISLAAGDAAAARRHATAALAADEWCEPAHRILVHAALADGDRAGACRALAGCDAMLADLGVTADARTRALRSELLAS